MSHAPRYDDERARLRRAVWVLVVVAAVGVAGLVGLAIEVSRVAGPLERLSQAMGGGRR